MNDSDLGKTARHFTSSAPLPEPPKPRPRLPEPSREGNPIGPSHLHILELPLFQPQTRNDGARKQDTLVDAMRDAAAMERALTGK